MGIFLAFERMTNMGSYRTADKRTAIRRLELALAFLAEASDDNAQAYQAAMKLLPYDCDADLYAIRMLIKVATEGEPLCWSYFETNCSDHLPDFFDGEETEAPDQS